MDGDSQDRKTVALQQRHRHAGFLLHGTGLVLLSIAACGDGGGPDPMGPTGTPNLAPIARMSSNPSTGDAPLVVHFDGSTSSDPDGELRTHSWDFGDGSTGSGVTTAHTYGTPGTYTVTLTVTDDRGATGSTSDTVSVNTPPGSGANTIRGSVWHDADGDALRGGSESGQPGIRVYLDQNANAILDANETSTLTESDGTFQFSGVSEDSTYIVRQDLDFGWTPTASGLGPSPDRRLVVSRVVGGADASEGAFPFQVALVSPAVSNNANAQFCGGTLIAANWVLTAAHCVDGNVPSQVQVLVGTQDLNQGGQRVDVVRIRINPQYGVSQGIDNDVALLELAASSMIPRTWPQRPDEPGLSECRRDRHGDRVGPDSGLRQPVLGTAARRRATHLEPSLCSRLPGHRGCDDLHEPGGRSRRVSGR